MSATGLRNAYSLGKQVGIGGGPYLASRPAVGYTRASPLRPSCPRQRRDWGRAGRLKDIHSVRGSILHHLDCALGCGLALPVRRSEAWMSRAWRGLRGFALWPGPRPGNMPGVCCWHALRVAEPAEPRTPGKWLLSQPAEFWSLVRQCLFGTQPLLTDSHRRPECAPLHSSCWLLSPSRLFSGAPAGRRGASVGNRLAQRTKGAPGTAGGAPACLSPLPLSCDTAKHW